MTDWRDDLTDDNQDEYLATILGKEYQSKRPKRRAVGNVYSGEGERCPRCGGTKFTHEEPKGLFCPEHSERISPGKYRVVFRSIHRRFDSYRDAYEFLTGLRFSEARGSLDIRDFRRNSPLAFECLTDEFLSERKPELKSPRHLDYAFTYALAAWEGRNIKSITAADLKRFFRKTKGPLSHLADKTRHNIAATLHAFWTWAAEYHGITIPKFPEIKFKMRRRNTITYDSQQGILAEIKRIAPPKVYFGIHLLATYPSIRPGDIRRIREGDFRPDSCDLLLRDTKTGDEKIIPLLPEDMAMAQSFGQALDPELYFFRHVKGHAGAKPGSLYGKSLLRVWWNRACTNLGITGVDMYGGTKHSTCQAMRAFGRSPAEIKRATMHTTSAFFERYFNMEQDDLREIYATARASGKPVASLRNVSSDE
jgi:hypothetical protein